MKRIPIVIASFIVLLISYFFTKLSILEPPYPDFCNTLIEGYLWQALLHLDILCFLIFIIAAIYFIKKKCSLQKFIIVVGIIILYLVVLFYVYDDRCLPKTEEDIKEEIKSFGLKITKDINEKRGYGILDTKHYDSKNIIDKLCFYENNTIAISSGGYTMTDFSKYNDCNDFTLQREKCLMRKKLLLNKTKSQLDFKIETSPLCFKDNITISYNGLGDTVLVTTPENIKSP